MSRLKEFRASRLLQEGSKDEIVFGEYKKSAAGYFFKLFFGFNAWLFYLVIAAEITDLIMWKVKGINSELFITFLVLTNLIILEALCFVVLKIIQWQYSKTIIVTNKGIWTSERHFAEWQFYAWGDIDSLEPFDSGITKMFKLKNLQINTKTQSNKIYYLSAREIDDILAYSREMVKPNSDQKSEQ